MSKTIKVEDSVYDELVKLLRSRETFSQVVQRLLAIQEGVNQFIAEVTLLPEYQRYRVKKEASDAVLETR